ncbi:hypothetical protein [Streptomyces shenzhenensis]|uniref:hypothetical protein n=1 Tax=Streptomyces shenzhenensis TaxID=943815 RepID=UPI001F3D9D1F|nr:hypothetical protein [Streptomyces shenzhenensis]
MHASGYPRGFERQHSESLVTWPAIALRKMADQISASGFVTVPHLNPCWPSSSS